MSNNTNTEENTLSLNDLDFTDMSGDLSDSDAIMAGLDAMDNEEESKKEPPKESTDPKGDTGKPKSKYSQEELLSLFDTLLFEGAYEELVKVGRNFTVKFRTRSVGESNEITRRIDRLELNTIMAVQNHTNVLTLAYAIVELNGQKLVDDDFKKRLTRIQSLPESLIIVLSHKLQEFDMKVMEAMKEGDSNF